MDEKTGIGEALRALGWDEGWIEAWTVSVAAHAGTDLLPARVVAVHRSRWVVAGGDGGDRQAIAAAGAETATVGDWVALEQTEGDGPGRIRAVLPRRTAFVRKQAGVEVRAQVVAANVDVALIVASLAEPVNARRLERYVAVAREGGARPLLVLTKTDVAPPAMLARAVAEAEVAAPGVDALVVSAAVGVGMDELAARLAPGATAVLLGPSGAGKSTLANALLGEARLRTGEMRDDGGGRHTTTHRELVRTPAGALLIDTPGMRELGLWSDEEGGFTAAFPDIEALAGACRFRDCAHDSEPGCAVTAAVAEGRLGADRLESWHGLRRELAWVERKTDETAAAREKARVRAFHRAIRRDFGGREN